MERSGRKRTEAEESALKRRRWPAALFGVFGFVALCYFLRETGFAEAVWKATEPWEQSLTGLLIMLFFVPVYFAVIKFAQSDNKVAETVPKVLRLTVFIFQGMARGFSIAACYVLIILLFRLVPFYALLIAFFLWMAVGLANLIRQFMLERAAKTTVTTLYEAIKNEQQDVLSALCEPEAMEGLAALDSHLGKLTWYRVMHVMLEERNFTVVVESIRNRMPKFEEVTIRPGGSCVVRVMAEGI